MWNKEGKRKKSLHIEGTELQINGNVKAMVIIELRTGRMTQQGHRGKVLVIRVWRRAREVEGPTSPVLGAVLL